MNKKKYYEKFGEDIKKTKNRINIVAETQNDSITKKLRSVNTIENSETNKILGIE